ncbi:MAG: LuxR family transcriptional regulator [Flavobacteriales bacterium]|jgi:DNA-binding CsgD family transcriptional regulator|nr:LuxR family transcriptional regulator [Flavobacteriales bacterium]
MLEKLTPKEIEVSRLITKGLPEKQICDKLGQKASTTHVHARNIRKKIGGYTKADIVRFIAMEFMSEENKAKFKEFLKTGFLPIIFLMIVISTMFTEIDPLRVRRSSRRGRKQETELVINA